MRGWSLVGACAYFLLLSLISVTVRCVCGSRILLILLTHVNIFARIFLVLFYSRFSVRNSVWFTYLLDFIDCLVRECLNFGEVHCGVNFLNLVCLVLFWFVFLFFLRFESSNLTTWPMNSKIGNEIFFFAIVSWINISCLLPVYLMCPRIYLPCLRVGEIYLRLYRAINYKFSSCPRLKELRLTMH